MTPKQMLSKFKYAEQKLGVTQVLTDACDFNDSVNQASSDKCEQLLTEFIF